MSEASGPKTTIVQKPLIEIVSEAIARRMERDAPWRPSANPVERLKADMEIVYIRRGWKITLKNGKWAGSTIIEPCDDRRPSESDRDMWLAMAEVVEEFGSPGQEDVIASFRKPHPPIDDSKWEALRAADHDPLQTSEPVP